jgi:ribonuclease HII
MELLNYYKENTLEVGIDEVGRGSLFGRVYVAGVILPNDLDDEYSHMIRDSKRLSAKKRKILRQYIEETAIDYYVGYEENTVVDKKNILRTTLDLMCTVVANLSVEPELLLIDGNRFYGYKNKDGKTIQHQCIIGGDDKYMSIAAASILAKECRDEYLDELCKTDEDVSKYGIESNRGYGTKIHMDAIKKYGITKYHRKSYAPCKDGSCTDVCMF